MDDAALVLAARSGDRDALATIYDRYGDRLHDYCWSILRDREEAADAFHDAFLAAAQRLDQLWDPSKLRPWLYAIARHEALRRAKARGRQQPTDEVDDVIAGGSEVDDPARQEEAVKLVWAAAAGLADRDRALLDLNLRHGLEGQELAEAIGVEPGHAYVLLSRLRDQVERSLGALLVARYGRRDCPDLNRLLEGWDGRFSPLIRKRVARHADQCETCAGRRRTLASPLALLGAMPLFSAPVELRDRILGDIQLAAASATETSWHADDEGFPPSAYAASPPHRRPALAAATVVGVAVVVLVFASLLGGLGSADDDNVPVVAAAGGTSTTAPVAAATIPPPVPVPDPTTGPSPTVSRPPTTAAGAGGSPATTVPGSVTVGPRLRLVTTALEFGATSSAQPLEIANDGDAPLVWTVSVPGPFLVTPAGGTVPAGGTTQATVRLDRQAAAEGRLAGTGQVSSDGGSGSFRLTAGVAHPPVMPRVSIDNLRLARSPCSTAPTFGVVSAVITDETGVDSAVLRWRDPAGATGSRDLVAGPANTYSGRLGPFTTEGTVTWWVEATDTLGATGRSTEHTVAVGACGR